MIHRINEDEYLSLLLEGYSNQQIMIKKVLQKDVIIKYFDKLNSFELYVHQTISTDLLKKFEDKILWTYANTRLMTEEMVEKHFDELNSIELYMHQDFSENLINKLVNKLDWELLTYYCHLNENILEKYYKFYKGNVSVLKNIITNQKNISNFILNYLKDIIKDDLNFRLIFKYHNDLNIKNKLQIFDVRQLGYLYLTYKNSSYLYNEDIKQELLLRENLRNLMRKRKKG